MLFRCTLILIISFGFIDSNYAVGNMFSKIKSLFVKEKKQAVLGDLSKLPESELATRIYDFMNNKFNHEPRYDFVHKLTPEFQAIYLTMLAEAEINNGGLDQLILNKGMDVFIECSKAFKAIGAIKTEGYFKESLKRIEADPKGFENFEVTFDDLDQKFYQYEEDIAALQLNYIKRNFSKFTEQNLLVNRPLNN